MYEGQWANDYRNGNGKMTYRNGSVYEGQWANDARNGNGKMDYRKGSVYEGQWANGDRNGNGKMVYKSGSYYEGEFKHDIRSGQGKFHGSYFLRVSHLIYSECGVKGSHGTLISEFKGTTLLQKVSSVLGRWSCVRRAVG